MCTNERYLNVQIQGIAMIEVIQTKPLALEQASSVRCDFAVSIDKLSLLRGDTCSVLHRNIVKDKSEKDLGIQFA